MFIHDCTVYRQTGDKWIRTVLKGVLWVDAEGVGVMKSGLKDANSLRLFIPQSIGFKPCKKDIVIKGASAYEIQVKLSELFGKGIVRTITTVDEYDFGGSMALYEAGGK